MLDHILDITNGGKCWIISPGLYKCEGMLDRILGFTNVSGMLDHILDSTNVREILDRIVDSTNV